mgnify:CR=1 FL=1|tara:strand:+ start:534 stop:761 length:228 start_codon:yes stop_codon:yes gene_type:complete
MGSVRDKMVAQIRAAKKGLTEKVEEIIETVKVRARTEEGHFVKDDPKTPENEAWVEKPKSEVKAKSKVKKTIKKK